MRSFEELHELIRSASAAKLDTERDVHWLDSKKILGVARNRRGALEVFLCGDRLRSRSTLLQRHMQFDTWQLGTQPPFDANRIVLPAAAHFIPIAALIAEELLRNGAADGELQRAFTESEPIVELALRRTALPEEVVLGLFGELFFLRMLLRAAEGARERACVLHAWKGFALTAHDFVFDGALVEVKTTTNPISRHHISSLSQVDPLDDYGKSVFLLSMGVMAVDASASNPVGRGGGLTLPELVKSLLGTLDVSEQNGQRNDTQEVLLRRIREYGGDSSVGYDHDLMADWDVYQIAYAIRFQRLYEMKDENIRTLRHRDIDDRFVPCEGLHFTLVLPDRVCGDLNPTTDLYSVVPLLLGRESAR